MPQEQKNEAQANPFYDDENPLWFLNEEYNPLPEHDVEAGAFTFHYREEYATFFLTQAAQGETISTIAAKLFIPLSIIKRWGTEIKTFGVILEIAEQHAMAYWETKGLEGMKEGKKGFSVAGWLKTMAILFPERYKDPDADHRPDLYNNPDAPGNVIIFQAVRPDPEEMAKLGHIPQRKIG